jgi:YHS domain-containing protein
MSMVCELSCAAENVDASKLTAQSKAKAGDFTKCPVSGVAFLVNDQSSQISQNGKSVFTCCETCAEIFTKAPDEYVANIH